MSSLTRLCRTVFWRWVLVVAYAGVIFSLSSLPGDDVPAVAVPDKLIHAVEFGILAVLLCRAFEAQMPALSHRAIMVVSILGTVCFGVTDEMHQLLVANRVADGADLAADSIGALLAAWWWRAAVTWRR